MTAICESCKGYEATLMMKKIDGLSQAAELVCVHCCYERVSTSPIGAYVIGRLKGVSGG